MRRFKQTLVVRYLGSSLAFRGICILLLKNIKGISDFVLTSNSILASVIVSLVTL